MAFWSALIEPVSSIFCKGLDIVDDLVEDKDLARKVKSELQIKMLDIANNEFVTTIKSQSDIIVAEATGDSWIQRNWRPLTMLMFVAIIANNYILAPYLGLLLGPEYKLMLDLPPAIWETIKLGLSGYVVGRSMEKIANGNGLSGLVGNLKNGK